MNSDARIEGFANANGKKFTSPNQAYKAYLAQTGKQDGPEAQMSYKTFLETAENGGHLDKMLSRPEKPILKPAVEEVSFNAEGPAKKSFTISTNAIIGVALAIGVIGTLIYLGTRKKQTAEAK